MLSASLLSTLVGLHLPGIGAIYRAQTLEFLRAVHVGDTLTAWFEVTAIDPADERIDIDAWIDNQRGERVLQGRTVASLLRG
jgi:acyl dehydratase